VNPQFQLFIANIACGNQPKPMRPIGYNKRLDEIGIFRNDNALLLIRNGDYFAIWRGVTCGQIQRMNGIMLLAAKPVR